MAVGHDSVPQRQSCSFGQRLLTVTCAARQRVSHGLTGSAARISGADTNAADDGQYDATGGAVNGYALIGGALLDASEAASFVVPTQQSQIETGINGAANQAAN